jgi:hypothetical protein
MPFCGWALDSNIIINLKDNNDTKEITITSDSDLQLSSLIRNNKLLIILDSNAPVRFINSKSDTILKNFQEESLNKGKLISFDFNQPEEFETTAFKINQAWVIKITPYDNSILSSEIAAKRNIKKIITSNTSQLELEVLSKKQKIFSFLDPITQEKIITIPEAKVIRNNLSTFIDFKILPSMAGLTILPLNDNLSVENHSNFLLITSGNYLNLSNHNFILENISDIFYEPTSLLSAELLQENESQLMLERIRERAIKSPDQNSKGYNYLKLVQFLFNQGFYKEARALLEFVNKNTDLISIYYQVRLLVGAVYFMDNDLEGANDLLENIDLNQVSFENKQEIRFWKSLSKISLLNYKEENHLTLKNSSNLEVILSSLMDSKINFLKFYHPDLLLQIKLKLLTIAANQGNSNLGSLIIRFIDETSLSIKDKKNLQYNKALLQIIEGQDQEALKLLETCSRDPLDNYFYSHCTFHKLELLRKENKIDTRELINKLQALSVLWRGDNFEAKVLNRLVSIYLEINDLSNSMRVLKLIAANNPNSAMSLKATAKARKIFIEYFKSYSSDSNLNQLAFFYEFQDFIPIGDLGDKIILQIAQSMLDLNLLDQAINLMKFQVTNRLIGINKEKIINKLLLTYQAKNDYQNIINLVEEFTTFPIKKNNPLLQERYQIYIKALIENRQYEDALAILYEDKSQIGDQLRAKAFAGMGDWEAFNDNSEPYLYSIRYKTDYKLNEEDKKKILKQNLAYFNNGQKDLLEKLFQDFKQRMKKGDSLSETNKIFYLLSKDLDAKAPINTESNQRITKFLKELLNL